MTRYSTFEALDEWITAAFHIAGPVPLAIVVNKMDLKDQIMCLYDEHEPREKAERHGGFAVWTSAKTGENVNPVFGQISLAVLRRMGSQELA